MSTQLEISHGTPVPLEEIPLLSLSDLRDALAQALSEGGRLSALLAHPAPGGGLELLVVVARVGRGVLQLWRAPVGERYPSLAAAIPQAHHFEREIAEQWGLVPEGHPWLKPVRFHAPWREVPCAFTGGEVPPIGVTDFFTVAGEEIHEVAVGPIHAGVIEPGHFRFQCHGETVFHLEISLGYQHRGIEKALRGGPHKRTLALIQTMAGDTTVGHTLAYAHALEALTGAQVPPRAQALRAIALELERLANHTGDLGALAGDVGYLPTASWCGRIRGDFLGLTAALCGSRFGRELVRPGGVGFDVDGPRLEKMSQALAAASRDVSGAAALLWETPTVLARFEGVGRVSAETSRALGLVGVAARASGEEIDVRRDFPSGWYVKAPLPVATWREGDVYGRAWVRAREVDASAAWCLRELGQLPEGEVRTAVGGLPPRHVAVSLVEGWRGEICHVALTGQDGQFETYKVIDPSFHNWMGLALALRGQQISDFPLCNKSFNLSYCGHDL